MKQSFKDTDWEAFAKHINGQISFEAAGNFKLDNIYSIQAANSKIEIIWADEPEPDRGPFVNRKTILTLALLQNPDLNLHIYKKDRLATMLAFFRSKKVRSGDAELDNKYLFICNDKSFVQKITPGLKSILEKNKFSNFVITTEKTEGINCIIVQINDLLTKENDLKLLYELGRMITKV